MLVFLFSAMLLIQDPHDHPGPEENTEFAPIPENNVVDFGPFSVTVPVGTLLTPEENAPQMFALLRQEYIPNCNGIFFSSSNEWDYGVAIQYVPDQVFSIYPQLDPEAWASIFKKRHLLNAGPGSADSEMVVPPNWDEQGHSFTLGMSYPLPDEQDHDIVIKKVWVSNMGAIIFSMRATSAGYRIHNGEINRILSSVKINPEALSAPPPADAISYTELYSVTPRAADPTPPAPASNESGIVLLGMFLGFVLLAVSISIVVLKKMKNRAS